MLGAGACGQRPPVPRSGRPDQRIVVRPSAGIGVPGLWSCQSRLHRRETGPDRADRAGRLGVLWEAGPRGKGTPVHDAIKVHLQTTGPGSCQVTVAGELDVATPPEARTALRAALADHRRVVIDLGGLRPPAAEPSTRFPPR